MKNVLISAITLILLFCSCSKVDNLENQWYGSEVTHDNVDVKVTFSSPDYVGGIKVCLDITNKNDKVIKKLYCSGITKNYYGEPIYCTITDKCFVNFSIVGPIYPGYQIQYVLNDKFYNTDLRYIDIRRIDIYYEDGSSTSLD